MSEPAPGRVIALVGRPNVGKSTLFNRLARRAAALTSAAPGTTRDWLEADADAPGGEVRIADTPGWRAGGALGPVIDGRLERLLREAKAALLVTAAGEGPTDEEAGLARFLRKLGTPVLPVCNKCDHPEDDPAAFEHARLGLGLPVPVSAERNRGLAELRARLGALAAGAAPTAAPARARERGVIVGQPNVGKSSLFNALVEDERSLVDDRPGTTRDPVSAGVLLGGARWELVDTAGVSHRGRRADALSRDAQARSLAALEHSTVCVLVLDVTIPLVRQDLRLADASARSEGGLAVALNKADLLEPGRAKRLLPEAAAYLYDRFPELGRFPVVLTSAKDGTGVPALRQSMAALERLRRTRIGPEALAGVAYDWPSPGPPWLVRQSGAPPPTFTVTRPHGAKLGARFVVNRLREAFGLHGVPVLVRWRGR